MSICRILVLGASGMLGRCVAEEVGSRAGELHLAVGHSEAPAVVGATVHRLDLRDAARTRSWVTGLRPDVVINCAGVVKSICNNGLEAAQLNSLLPHLVADALGAWEGRLVHISTDCVFSGTRGGYTESDQPDPVDLYGRTKLAGEVDAAPHLTIRTSFIGHEFGAPRGLLGWFLAQTGEVTGYRNAIWSGLTADALAAIVIQLALRPEVTGLLHVCGESIDKYTLLHIIADSYGKQDVTIRPADEPRCDRSMRSNRLAGLGITVPRLRDMISRLRANMVVAESGR